MRLLLPCVLSAVLAAGLAPVPASAEAVPIMPLEQVKPGMKGYGMTVFKGETPERFEFEVIGTVDNWQGLPHVIMVRLSGGPKDARGREVLELTRIIAGMSGSPLYIDGKLVGALSLAPEFATTSKAFITPIQGMLDQRKYLEPLTAAAADYHHIDAGEYFCTCLVWGDTEDCMSATVTSRDRDLVYATGHEMDTLYTIGRVEVPVFHVPVLDVLEMQSQAVKITPNVGQMIGALVYNGREGSIIRLGQKAPSFSVTLSIADVWPDEVIRHSYQAAQHFKVGDKLLALVSDVLTHTVDPSTDPRLSATIWVSGYDQPFRLTDRAGHGLKSMAALIEKLIREDYPSRKIAKVDLSVTVPKKNPMEVIQLTPHISQVTKKPEYTIVAQDVHDRHIVERHTEMDMEELTKTEGRALLWLDGATVQEYLLHDVSVRAAAPLLFQIADREGLYLLDPHANERTDAADSDPAEWHELAIESAVLHKLSGASARLFIKDSFGYGIKVEKQQGDNYGISIERVDLSDKLK